MKIELINKSKHATPNYSTKHSAGLDLRANLDDAVVLKPLERALIKTGLLSLCLKELKHKCDQEVV